MPNMNLSEKIRQLREIRESRRKYLRDRWAWSLVSPSVIARRSVAKKVAEEVTDPVERQWLVEEVRRIAMKKERIRQERRAESGYAKRFTTDIGKAGQAAGEAAVDFFVEAPKRLLLGAIGKDSSPDDVRFFRQLESAKLGENPFLPEDAPFTQKVAVGGARMGPGVLGGAAAFTTLGPFAAGTFWAAQEFPESKDDFLEAGLSPGASALAGGGVAGAVGAVETVMPVPGAMKGLAGTAIKRSTAAASKKLGSFLGKRGVGALRPEISMAAKRVAEQAAGYGIEVGTEGVQEAIKETGLQAAARVSEDVEARPLGDIPRAFGRGVKEAAPGMLMFASGGAGLGIAGGVKQIRQTKIEKEILQYAEEGKTPSRSIWEKKWHLPRDKDGKVPPRYVRKDVVMELAGDLRARDQAKAEMEVEEAAAKEAPEMPVTEPTAAVEAPEAVSGVETAPAPEAVTEAPETSGVLYEEPAVPAAEAPAVEQGIIPPEDATVALNKAAGAQIRETLDLPALGEEAVQTFDATMEKVASEKADEKALDIAGEVLVSKRQTSSYEHVAMVLKAAKLMAELDVQQAAQAEAAAAGKRKSHYRATEQIETITGQLSLLTEAARYSRREVARALSIGQYRLSRERFDVVSIMQQMQGAKGPKGKLTKEERSLVARLSKEYATLVKEVKIEEQKAQVAREERDKITAEKVLAANKPRKKISQGMRERAKAEQEDIKKRIRQLGIRVNDITVVSAEGLYLIGRLGIAYIKEGVGTLAGVVERLRADVSDLDLSDHDVNQALISRSPRAKARARSEANKRVAKLTSMARMLVELESLAQGTFVKPKGRAPVPAEIKVLQKKLRQARAEFYRSEIDAAKLERAIETVNQLQDQLENGLNVAKKEPREVSPELTGVQEQIKQLRTEIRVDKELAKVNEQLRTGVYLAPVKKEKELIDPGLERKQIELFRKRREVRQAILDAAPWGTRKILGEIAFSAKAIAATADMSFTMRQNLWQIFSHPILGAKAFGPALGALLSEYKADQINNALRESENGFLYEQSGLALLDASSPDAQQRSEVYRGRVIENFKILGIQNPFGMVMSASARHAATISNLMRASAFDLFIKKNPNATQEEMRAMADYINVSTGLGNLGRFGAVGETLQLLFFSPKFAVSRVQTPWALAKYWKLPRVRAQIAEDMTGVAATGGMVLMLAQLAGAGVQLLDPDDPDWGKIRIGDMRIDIWGGFQQPMRVITRLATMGLGDVDYDPLEILGRFATFKLAPAITVPLELVRGKTAVGEETTKVETIGRSLVPLMLRDVKEAWREGGAPAAMAAGTLAGLGVGVSTYRDSETTTRKRIKKLKIAGEYTEAEQLRFAWNRENPEDQIVTVSIK